MADRTYDEAKFVELVMYVAEGLRDNEAGGATKLNKALWYSEIEHMRRHGTTITGAEYRKLPNGPAPQRLLPVREQLTFTKQADLVESPLGSRTEERLIPLRAADTSVFTDDELETINGVLERLRPMNGKQVSDLSHEEPAWFLPEEMDPIPPELAFFRPAVVTPQVRERVRRIAAERGLVPQ